MNRTIRRTLIAVLIPVTALAVGACSDSGSGGRPGMGHGLMSSSPNPAGGHSTADVEFAQMMIAHHQQAVEMATLVETRANDAEVKALAAQIKAAQQPEIATMSGGTWRRPRGCPSLGEANS